MFLLRKRVSVGDKKRAPSPKPMSLPSRELFLCSFLERLPLRLDVIVNMSLRRASKHERVNESL
jgi:hypothetical protein